MRPSKLKTPLAKLRAMLKIQTGEITKKRTGQTVKTFAPLSRQDVAGWLGCGVDNISSIESGRVKLTSENAEIILQQTGVSMKWLLGIYNNTHPINLAGERYTQTDFERAQKAIKRPAMPALKAQMIFAENVGWLATILLCACQCDEIDRYTSKLRSALADIFHSFPKETPVVDFRQFINLTEGWSVTDHDNPLKALQKFYPMLVKFDKELLKIVNNRIKQAKPRND
jgi:hypothetical protein